MGEWEKNRAPPLKNSGESEKSPPLQVLILGKVWVQEGTFFPREFWWNVLRLFQILGKR